MRRLVSTSLVFVVILSVLGIFEVRGTVAAADDQSLLQADHEFVQAAAKGDTATLGRVLDADFAWTDADGKTRTKAEVLTSLPAPALGNESGAQVKQRTYGQVDRKSTRLNSSH